MPEKAGRGAREEGRESNPEGLRYTVWTEGKKRGRQGNNQDVKKCLILFSFISLLIRNLFSKRSKEEVRKLESEESLEKETVRGLRQ